MEPLLKLCGLMLTGGLARLSTGQGCSLMLGKAGAQGVGLLRLFREKDRMDEGTVVLYESSEQKPLI